ncbi:kinase-like protein [Gyrodon lividus]|nr:kinase-like protein [Gyrodon lividus]
MVVVIKVFYNGQGECQPKPSCFQNAFGKMLSGIKFSRTSFKIERKASPRSGSASTASESALASVSDGSSITKCPQSGWPSSVSIVISPMGMLPPARLAPASQEETAMLRNLGDAFYDPEVLDVRRQVNMLGVVREFVLRGLRMLNTLSPVYPPLMTRWSERSGALDPTGSDLVVATPRRTPFSSLLAFFSSKEVDVCIQQFQVLGLLGTGAYGRVYRVMDRISAKPLALKVIKKNQLKSREVKTIRSEQDALVRTLGNPHSLQLVASFHDSANFYMAVALKTGGDLQKQIDRWDRIPIDIARFYAAELFVGLFSLHRKGVLHRDIKPGNVLLDEWGHVIISDFGLSKVFDLGGGARNSVLESPYCFNGTTNQLSQAPYLTSGCCGTFSHMAPEIFLEQKYGFAVDYWALAITVYEMLTGGTPWYSSVQAEFANQICHAPLVCPDDMTPEAKDLLKKMLAKEPMERLTYEEMRSHPFFEGIDWEKIECRSLTSPYVPKRDADFMDCTDPVDDDIKRGTHYTWEDDPLPQFSWCSPSFTKCRRRSPFIQRAIGLVQQFRGWVSSCKSWHRQFLKTLPGTSPSAMSLDKAAPASRLGETSLMDDSEAREEWVVDSGGGISRRSPPSSALVSISLSDHGSSSNVEQTLVHNVSPATPSCPLARISTFIRSARRRRAPSGDASPSSLMTRSPSTLVASSPSNGASSGLSRSTKFQKWITRLWCPVPTVRDLTGDDRMSIA